MINDRKCTKVTITMLLIKPGRPYSMEIRGINKSGGKGKWSETIIATLSKPVPSKPPTPKIMIINHETALVMVQTPTRSCDSESPVKDWLVEFTKSDTKWEKIKSTAHYSETQEITVKGLDPEKVYYFRVYAVNAEGASQPSALVTKGTSNVDPMQPINLHLSSKISYSFLIINWQMPTENQEYITHYEVRKRAVRDFVHDDPKQVEKKDGTSYTFENLKSKTQYLLSVRACNDNGTSKWAEIFGETCSKTIASVLVAKLPISKKDAKNKGCACASVFYDNDNDKSNIDDCNIDANEGETIRDNEHSNNDESDQDKYHDALTSLPVAKYGDKREGKTKASASSASVSGISVDIMSENDNDKDKSDKDNSNTNTHSSSVDCTRDSTGKAEFRERSGSVMTSRPDKGTQ